MNKINISSLPKTPVYSQINSLLQWITEYPKSFRIDSPIEIFDSGTVKNLGIKANNPLKKNDYIFSVSTIKCITGLDLIDCSPTKSYEINKMADNIAGKYYSNNPNQFYYTINLIKILLQIFVHSTDPSLSLHPYASYLNSLKMTNPLYWKEPIIKQIYSPNLQTLITNTHTQFRSFHKDLEESSIFGLSLPQMIRIMSLIRSRNLNFIPESPKTFSKDFISIMCPLVDLINHSFQPNCKLEGEFIPVEGESFVVVRAIENIAKDEELTINYGDYSNNDFLMKFGFLNKSNKFNELKIELDYEGFLDYTEQQFDLKRKILRTLENISLEEIGLYSHKINEDIIKMLRIYFLTNDDIMNNTEISTYMWRDFKNMISRENEKKICEFMIKSLTNILKVYRDNKKKYVIFDGFKNEDEMSLDTLDDKIKDLDLKNMLQFCLEEEQLLQNNMNFFVKKLNSI